MSGVGKAAHACCQELINGDGYVVAGGLEDWPATLVATDGTVTRGPRPNPSSADLRSWTCRPSREALKWARPPNHNRTLSYRS